MATSKETLADRCEAMLRLLSDHEDGLSQDALSARLGWPLPLVNDVLCELGFGGPRRLVRCIDGRDKGRKIKLYILSPSR